MFQNLRGAIIGTAIVFAAPVAAFDMGELTPILPIGQDGPWTTRADGEAYVFDNDSAPNAIKYYYVIADPSTAGRRSVTVDIEFRQPAPSSRAGLMFGFDEADNSYFMFTIAPDRSVLLFERVPGGGEARFRGSIGRIGEGVNTVSLSETSDLITISINGEPLYSSPDRDMVDGGIGILAWGEGETAFQGFDLTIRDQ